MTLTPIHRLLTTLQPHQIILITFTILLLTCFISFTITITSVSKLDHQAHTHTQSQSQSQAQDQEQDLPTTHNQLILDLEALIYNFSPPDISPPSSSSQLKQRVKQSDIRTEARRQLLEELGGLSGEGLEERVYWLCRREGVRHRKIVWRGVEMMGDDEGFVE